MAYRNLLNETLVGATGDDREKDIFIRLRDFVCKRNGTYDYSTTGIGWTLHDSSYAVDEDTITVNDWYVLYSAGEGGEEQLYYKFTLIDNYIQIHGWQSWNNAAHSGGGINYYRDNAFNIGPDPENMYIYGDLDFVHLSAIGISGNTNWYNGCFGKAETSWLTALEEGRVRNVQTCSSALTAGSDVSITVSGTTTSGVQSPLWSPGLNLMIMDAGNFEMITVKTNDEIDTITADLSLSYTAGAKLAVAFPYIVSGGSQTTHFYLSGQLVVMHGMDGDHPGGINEAVTMGIQTNGAQSYMDPGWNGAYLIVPYDLWTPIEGAGYIGTVPHCGAITATGLSNLEYLDDMTVSGTGWRYNNVTNARVYKEVS